MYGPFKRIWGHSGAEWGWLFSCLVQNLHYFRREVVGPGQVQGAVMPIVMITLERDVHFYLIGCTDESKAKE